MSSAPHNIAGEYQPASVVEPPVIYAWPPRFMAAAKFLFIDIPFSWNLVYIGLAALCWAYLTPSMETMKTLSLDWYLQIWLRNFAVLMLVAGGLHWWLYMRKGQKQAFKFHKQWMDTDNDKFLWNNQVWDNMFWSIVSGVTIVTAYEALTFWIYANGFRSSPTFVDHPLYLVLCMYGVFFVGTAHFYCIHRLSHWPPLYKVSHELHHRNINTGPWTGISMHPTEHLLYFSVLVIVWFIPVHPFIIVLISLWFMAGPAPSHSDFDYLGVKGKNISTGDWFHSLHHQYFDLNYGNTLSPLDRVFGSWHNGSKESLIVQKQRGKKRRKNNAAQIKAQHKDSVKTSGNVRDEAEAEVRAKTETKVQAKPDVVARAKSESAIVDKPQAKAQGEIESNTQAKRENVVQEKTKVSRQITAEPKVRAEPEVKTQLKVEKKNRAKQKVASQEEVELMPEAKAKSEPIENSETKSPAKTVKNAVKKPPTKSSAKKAVKSKAKSKAKTVKKASTKVAKKKSVKSKAAAKSKAKAPKKSETKARKKSTVKSAAKTDEKTVAKKKSTKMSAETDK